MWIFGYGSLIWKVDFPFETRLIGYIKGYTRRFWQLSEDHRGVPGAPGLVVTLVQSSTESSNKEQVWGVAYKIADKDVANVNAHLDYREKGGYSKLTTTFFPVKSSSSKDQENAVIIEPFTITAYVGLEDNRLFHGAAPLEEIGQQISRSIGPSGPNSEYLFNLAESLRSISPDLRDDHVFELELIVKRLKQQQGAEPPNDDSNESNKAGENSSGGEVVVKQELIMMESTEFQKPVDESLHNST